MTNPRDSDGSNEQDCIWLDLVCRQGSAGDRAMQSLFRKYHGPLVRFLRSQGAAAADIEDFVQETFIRMHKGACTFRREARVSTWLFQIALHRYRDDGKKAKPPIDTVEELPEEVRAPSVSYEEELQDCFDRALALFAKAFPACAAIIQGVVSHGWSGRDVASFRETDEGAAREYLAQCRKRFKQFAEPCREYLTED